MPFPFYVQIEGATSGPIKGDVDHEGREGMIRGYTFSSATSIPRHPDTGQPTGTRAHHPIVFTKHVDKSSPMLWQAMTSGERLTSVRFDFYRINNMGKNENYYSIVLKDAIIVEMQSALVDNNGASGLDSVDMREHLHLTFRRIEWENKVDGTMAANDWVNT